MASSGKEKEKDIASEQVNDIDHEESGSEDDEEIDHTLPEASTPSTSSNKKKKKQSKAMRALNALRGKDNIPQELVDVVLDKVKTEHGDSVPYANEETVRKALQQMKIKDVIQGKSGIGGKNRKDVGTHKVRFLSTSLDQVYDLCRAVLEHTTCPPTRYGLRHQSGIYK